MMTLRERIIHAILFEIGAASVTTVAVLGATEHDAQTAMIMSVLISLMAVLWNLLFNAIFDRFFTGKREQRGIFLRMGHSIAFEGGLLIATIPLVAYFLEMTWLQAFWADIGITLIILVYTFIFNWIYDHLRLFFISSDAV